MNFRVVQLGLNTPQERSEFIRETLAGLVGSFESYDEYERSMVDQAPEKILSTSPVTVVRDLKSWDGWTLFPSGVYTKNAGPVFFLHARNPFGAEYPSMILFESGTFLFESDTWRNGHTDYEEHSLWTHTAFEKLCKLHGYSVPERGLDSSVQGVRIGKDYIAKAHSNEIHSNVYLPRITSIGVRGMGWFPIKRELQKTLHLFLPEKKLVAQLGSRLDRNGELTEIGKNRMAINFLDGER